MKKVLFAAVIFLGLMSCTTAQQDNSAGTGTQTDLTELIDSRVTDLTERLSLTSEQIEQVRAIYEKTLGSESESSADQRHEEIMDLLNEEQKEIYAAYLTDREQRFQRGSAGGRNEMDMTAIIDSRVEDLTERLSLTSQQAEQVRAIYEETLGSPSETSSDQRHNDIMDLLNDEQKEIYSTYLEEREQRTRGRNDPGIQI